MSWETYDFSNASTSTSQQRVLHNTSVLEHSFSHHRSIAPEYSAPTLSLLPIPRKPDYGNGQRQFHWKWCKFTNDAREDSKDGAQNGLKLRHWSKVPANLPGDKNGEDVEMPPSDDEAEDTERYPFAKYTIQTPIVYTYTNEEYAMYVEDSAESGWTKDETDYLFGLLKEYSARFYIVLDRYEYPGTEGNPPVKREVEDLKDRYYSVVRKLIRARAGDKPEDQKASESLLLSHGFDREQEKLRREHVARLWNRTPAQIQEETLLYTELLRLSQTATSFSSQRHRLLRLLAGIESGLPDIQTLDDRLTQLNLDPQIRGVKGGLWGNILSGVNSAGPSAGRKKRGGTGHASMDWGDSPNVGGNNLVVSLGGSSGTRQLLPPAQQAEYDAKHCIYRAPPGSNLINSKNTHTPVHARSSKFPIPKPILASHLQAYSQVTAADGSVTQPQTVFTKLDIHPTKLMMPTKENLELMDRVFGAATQWVEVQKQLERADVELAMQRKRLGLTEIATKDKPQDSSQAAGSASNVPAGGSGISSRKRTMSTSSDDTSASHKRIKA